MTPTTVAKVENPAKMAGPSGDGFPPRRKAVIVAMVMTLTAIVAGVLLIVLGTTWTREPGTIEPATTASAETIAAENASELDAVTSGELEGGAVAMIATTGMSDVSAIAADVVDSVVTVNVTVDVRGPRDLAGSGSGIVLDEDGTVVTNAHVVSDATSATVTLTDGSTVAATIVGVDESNDVAVLSIDASGLSPISIGTSSGLAVGNPVIAVGNPLGLEGGPSVTTGIVSALGRVLEDTSVSLTGVIQTDAAITEGSSGGALLDVEGRLIGVTTAVGVSSVGVEGIGFAIPVEIVMTVVAQLTSG